MANLFFLPWRPIFDLSNNIGVPGAQLLFTQAPDTNTKKNVYQDEAKTILHTNPVICDGAGNLPGLIYLDEAIIYRVRGYAATAEAGVDDPLFDIPTYVPGLFADAAALEPVADAAAESATSAAESAGAAVDAAGTAVTAATQASAVLNEIEAALPADFTVGELSDGLPVNVKWFGAAIDGTTDDSAEIAATQTYLLANPMTGYGYAGKSLHKTFLPLGISYQGTTPIDVRGSGIIEGVAGSIFSGGGSVLKFATDTSGIRFQNIHNTGDTGYDAGTLIGSSGSILRNVALQGAYTVAATAHAGVRVKDIVTCEDVFVKSFAGSGFYSNANAVSVSGDFGNASISQYWRCHAQTCGEDGFHSQGADSNYSLYMSCSAVQNGGYGFNFSSFLGDVALACHAAGNTLGGYHSSGASNSTLLLGCYNEGGSPNPTFSAATLRVGGVWAGGATGGGFIYALQDRTHINVLQVDTDLFVDDDATIGGDLLAGTIGITGAFSVGGTGQVTASGSSHGFGPTTGTATDHTFILNTTNTFNKIIAKSWAAGVQNQDGAIQFQRGTGVYFDGASTGSSMFMRPDGTTTTGTWTTTGLSVAGKAVSTSATAGIGYATGAGGAVTQTTSRTTAPPAINKVCGAITLVSAAGSASWQTFTVSNSTVAATDTVRVCQKSGADKYMIHVTAVGAGTFDVTFATTGGTTTEQPVFNFSVLKAVAA